MRHILGFAVLAMLPGLAQADWYIGGALAHMRAKAEDFRFHNPVGAPFAVGAPPGPYIPMNSVSDRDKGTAWSIRGGYVLPGSPWRAELDYTRRGEVGFRGYADFGPGANFQQDLRVKSESLLLMGYYDHSLDRDWSLYGGLGIGRARNRSEGMQGRNLGGTGTFPSASHDNMAWALAFGVSRKLTDRLTGDLGYRYVHLGKADTGTTDGSQAGLAPFPMNPNERLEAKLRVHEFRAGVNYRF
jgi:opacity protein-like surface antigen